MGQPSGAGTPSLRLQAELYQYVFEFSPARGARITLSQLKTHPRTYFSPSFREKWMGDSVSGGVLPVDTDANPLAAGEEEPPAGMVKGPEDGL